MAKGRANPGRTMVLYALSDFMALNMTIVNDFGKGGKPLVCAFLSMMSVNKKKRPHLAMEAEPFFYM